MAWLRIIFPGGREAILPVDREDLRLGRETDNKLVLDDQRASRHHARIVWTGQAYLLEDLESVNGTFINGNRVLRHLLNHGDTIQIGDIRLVFDASGVAVAAPPPTPAAWTAPGPIAGNAAQAPAPRGYPAPRPRRSRGGLWVFGLLGCGGFVLVACMAGLGYYFWPEIESEFFDARPSTESSPTTGTTPVEEKNPAETELASPATNPSEPVAPPIETNPTVASLPPNERKNLDSVGRKLEEAFTAGDLSAALELTFPGYRDELNHIFRDRPDRMKQAGQVLSTRTLVVSESDLAEYEVRDGDRRFPLTFQRVGRTWFLVSM